MKNFKCPHCKADLREVGIYELQDVEKKYEIDYSAETKSFDYGNSSETDSFGNSLYFCASCDRELLLSYDDIFSN